jgi:hypothetical protein
MKNFEKNFKGKKFEPKKFCFLKKKLSESHPVFGTPRKMSTYLKIFK